MFPSSCAWLRRARLRRFFRFSYGAPGVDVRVVSGIICVVRHGLMWCDAPKKSGPHRMINNRLNRWNRMGVFTRIFAELVGKPVEPDRIMIDTTCLKAHRTPPSLLKGDSSSTYRERHGRG